MERKRSSTHTLHNRQRTMNDIIKFIWANGLLPRKGLKTTAGEEIEITATGEEHGNMFKNATLTIGGRECKGNVAMHPGERDLFAEEEDTILFLTASNGAHPASNVPVLQIKCTQSLLDAYTDITNGNIPCTEVAIRYSSINLHNYLSRLLVERIEDKADRIARMYAQCDKRWNDVLFKLLARSFGFGIQGQAFDEWATLLDMQAIYKHRNNPEQVEAILFGQAGLLAEESIPAYYREEALKSEYYTTLTREYKFLKNKFGLNKMKHSTWNYGNATPHIRISRLATLLCNERLSINAVEDCGTTTALRQLLQVQPSAYWQHHTQFGSTTTIGAGDISNRQLDVLIINCIIPMLYSYGRHREEASLCNMAEDLLHEIDCEENSITRKWANAGVRVNCAADSQAIIQLNNEYCRKKRCTHCRFAHTYLKDILNEEY